MNPLPVVILAGGLATRLRPITEKIPKALVEVAGRPFLAHQLEFLRRQNISDVVLCVGYLGEMIREQFGDGSEYGLRLRYSFDGPRLLGTAGAIRQALPMLPEAFFVLYGDSYLPVSFAAVQNDFEAARSVALMTVFRNEGKWDASNVWFEGGQIRAYDKKHPTPEMHHIDYGLSIWSRDAFTEIPPDEPRDLADLFAHHVARQEVKGFEVEQRFYEIGSHQGLQELDLFLQTPHPTF
jgi:NDP-sugar pyrophosphorylase family protein